MQVAGRDGIVGDSSLEIFIPSKEARAKLLNDLLDRKAETIADARARFERVLMVAFEQRFGGFFRRARQARNVQ